jgi:hypothetical protein
MATREISEPMREQNLAAFARKVAAWGETLAPSEQLFLDAILIHAAAATASDVQGFMARLPDEFPEAQDEVQGRILRLLQSIYPAYRINEEGETS